MAEPERTEDGRYIVVDGRRWRATDPSIPEKLRAELVSELMSARRAVRDATTADEEEAARGRVHDAKVALGERGAPWWEPVEPDDLNDRLLAATRSLLRNRSPESTICPSDAARVVGGPDWRDHLDAARRAVDELARQDVVVVTQGGERVPSAAAATGPVRVGRGPAWT